MGTETEPVPVFGSGVNFSPMGATAPSDFGEETDASGLGLLGVVDGALWSLTPLPFAPLIVSPVKLSLADSLGTAASITTVYRLQDVNFVSLG
ncbi:hypothetical protein FRC15_006575 [Serendipita sp. 397]|nr:hypothetical protein FRC15_006575 [Serendipita sp. 397]